MTGALLALLLVLFQPGQVPANRAPAAEAALPPTRLGTDLLGQHPIVALVSTRSVTAFGMGTAVVRAEIDELLHGSGVAAGDSVVIFAYQGHFPSSGRALVYLLPYRRGGRYQLLELVNGRDPNWTAKLKLTRATVALTAIRAREPQAAATFDLLARSLESANAWTRSYAVRELGWMSLRQSWVISQARLRRLELIAARTVHELVRLGVERVAKTLASRARALPPANDEESSRS
jgi:hypothetical protein